MSAKYAFITGEGGNYSVRTMCRWAKVSTSGYHDWKPRPALGDRPVARRAG